MWRRFDDRKESGRAGGVELPEGLVERDSRRGSQVQGAFPREHGDAYHEWPEGVEQVVGEPAGFGTEDKGIAELE